MRPMSHWWRHSIKKDHENLWILLRDEGLLRKSTSNDTLIWHFLSSILTLEIVCHASLLPFLHYWTESASRLENSLVSSDRYNCDDLSEKMGSMKDLMFTP